MSCYLFSARGRSSLVNFFGQSTRSRSGELLLVLGPASSNILLTPPLEKSNPTQLTSVRLGYASPALVASELRVNLMLSQQNALSITWPTAVDSGELLLVLGPESIQPGLFL